MKILVFFVPHHFRAGWLMEFGGFIDVMWLTMKGGNRVFRSGSFHILEFGRNRSWRIYGALYVTSPYRGRLEFLHGIHGSVHILMFSPSPISHIAWLRMLEMPFLHPCQNGEDFEVLVATWRALVLRKYLYFRIWKTSVSGDEMTLRIILEKSLIKFIEVMDTQAT